MDRTQNGSNNSRERRHFSPQQKVAIVKEHLADGVQIGDPNLVTLHDVFGQLVVARNIGRLAVR